MKIVEINSVLHGSTGKIARQLGTLAAERGHTVTLCVPKGRHNAPMETGLKLDLFGSRCSEDLHILLTRLTGFHGCFSSLATASLLRRLKKEKPDLIHLHNLHNSYINLPQLFRFIKKHRIPVVWTLHDCWAFTGQCPHFTLAKCKKWKSGCHHCPQYRHYPQSYVDRSKSMWKKKKSWFTGVEKLTVVTPSQWLSRLAGQSFLKDYPIRVIHNGIDLDVFQPRVSNFRQKHGLEGKKIILGVAFGWPYSKGLDVFIELSKGLDESYQIILVGTDDGIDQSLPGNILSIHRTHDQKELAELYTAADVLANPTREENFPTVNMEALACGTPVVTFDAGGSPEILDETCGSVVPCDDIAAFEQELRRVCQDRPYTQEACLRRAWQFSSRDCFEDYLRLYEVMP